MGPSFKGYNWKKHIYVNYSFKIHLSFELSRCLFCLFVLGLWHLCCLGNEVINKKKTDTKIMLACILFTSNGYGTEYNIQYYILSILPFAKCFVIVKKIFKLFSINLK